MLGEVNMAGDLKVKVSRAPGPGLKWKLRNNLRWEYIYGLLGNGAAKTLSRLTGIPTLTSELSILLRRADGTVVNYGVVSRRVVTTAFVNFMVDQMQTETSAWGDMKYHDFGVGTTAAAITDTAIETTDGESRATGSQTEVGGSPNIYRTVGTVSYTSTKAITEHLVANDSSAGTAIDRHVFSAINVVSGDSIQATYDLTVSSGG